MLSDIEIAQRAKMKDINEIERLLFLSVFHRLLISLAKRLLPHLENLHSVLFLALKAVPQAADILR